MGTTAMAASPRLSAPHRKSSHDAAGIIRPPHLPRPPQPSWNLRVGDAACDRVCNDIYAKFSGQALLDDRDERAGAKFADADLMGHPWQIIVGRAGRLLAQWN